MTAAQQFASASGLLAEVVTSLVHRVEDLTRAVQRIEDRLDALATHGPPDAKKSTSTMTSGSSKDGESKSETKSEARTRRTPNSPHESTARDAPPNHPATPPVSEGVAPSGLRDDGLAQRVDILQRSVQLIREQLAAKKNDVVNPAVRSALDDLRTAVMTKLDIELAGVKTLLFGSIREAVADVEGRTDVKMNMELVKRHELAHHTHSIEVARRDNLIALSNVESVTSELQRKLEGLQGTAASVESLRDDLADLQRRVTRRLGAISQMLSVDVDGNTNFGNNRTGAISPLATTAGSGESDTPTLDQHAVEVISQSPVFVAFRKQLLTDISDRLSTANTSVSSDVSMELISLRGEIRQRATTQRVVDIVKQHAEMHDNPRLALLREKVATLESSSVTSTTLYDAMRQKADLRALVSKADATEVALLREDITALQHVLSSIRATRTSKADDASLRRNDGAGATGGRASITQATPPPSLTPRGVAMWPARPSIAPPPPRSPVPKKSASEPKRLVSLADVAATDTAAGTDNTGGGVVVVPLTSSQESYAAYCTHRRLREELATLPPMGYVREHPNPPVIESPLRLRPAPQL